MISVARQGPGDPSECGAAQDTMLEAFVRHPDHSIQRLDSIDALSETISADDVAAWVDLESPDEGELAELGRMFSLDRDALDDCLHGAQRPRIDEFDEYVFLVLYAMVREQNDSEPEPHKLAVFFGPRFLITVHRESLPSVNHVRQRCSQHPGQWIGRGLDWVLYSIIDGVADRYVMLAEAYDRRVDELEDRSLAPDVDASLLEEMSALREQVLDLRRVALAQRDLVMPVARGEFDFISEKLELRFSHVRDHLTQVVEVTDGLREMLNGVRDNYHSALVLRMNAIMKTLTIFAAVMLPLTLVAGIYGMNVPLWPSPEDPASFWAVLGVMGAMGIGLLMYFRWKRWV